VRKHSIDNSRAVEVSADASLQQGHDSVFGSRFSRGGHTVDYTRLKLVLNRLGNKFIQLLFRIPCDDISNAFKMYRGTVIAGIQPLLARQFNLTVELPLKPIVRGYRYAIVPNTWINRGGCVQVQDQENGIAVFVHRALLLPPKDPGAGTVEIRARASSVPPRGAFGLGLQQTKVILDDRVGSRP
jgi:hypothetical protein